MQEARKRQDARGQGDKERGTQISADQIKCLALRKKAQIEPQRPLRSKGRRARRGFPEVFKKILCDLGVLCGKILKVQLFQWSHVLNL